jgi:SAM-dependent methyltransferase
MTHPAATRYENSWDDYSKSWDKDVPGHSMLGEEWGNKELTLQVFAKHLQPHLLGDTRALEVGPGGGKYSALAAPHCKALTCVDVSQEMLNRVKSRLNDDAKLRTIKVDGMDVHQVPDESVDFAFSIDVFVHLDLEDVYAYLREFHRMLVPGGRLVLQLANFMTHNGWDLLHREADLNRAQFKQWGRINLISPEIARKLFEKARFEDIEIDTELVERDIFVVGRKPLRKAEKEAPARVQRILARTGARAVHLDLLERLPNAVISAPTEKYVARETYDWGGDRRDALFAHAPTRVGYQLVVPVGAKLRGAYAYHPGAVEAGARGGVRFIVEINHGLKRQHAFNSFIDPAANEADRGWHDFEVDLSQWAGETLFVVLETAFGEGSNEFKWSCWGEPAIVV